MKLYREDIEKVCEIEFGKGILSDDMSTYVALVENDDGSISKNTYELDFDKKHLPKIKAYKRLQDPKAEMQGLSNPTKETHKTNKNENDNDMSENEKPTEDTKEKDSKDNYTNTTDSDEVDKDAQEQLSEKQNRDMADVMKLMEEMKSQIQAQQSVIADLTKVNESRAEKEKTSKVSELKEILTSKDYGFKEEKIKDFDVEKLESLKEFREMQDDFKPEVPTSINKALGLDTNTIQDLVDKGFDPWRTCREDFLGTYIKYKDERVLKIKEGNTSDFIN